ncbi:MAG TPA: hypothetical protein VIB11_09610 [Pedococcus sp.]|jgi:uncharacterized membrane protein YoaK (UPF0700 family)|uniref:hypothetical protein n=1 Tax=Pedococcus sp. TaxID=2860345 RepID=UPI002F91DEC2
MSVAGRWRIVWCGLVVLMVGGCLTAATFHRELRLSPATVQVLLNAVLATVAVVMVGAAYYTLRLGRR